MKKVMIIALALVISLSLFACNSPANEGESSQSQTVQTPSDDTEQTQPAGDKTLKITYISPLIGHPFWVAAKRGAEAAAAEMNAEVEWVGPQDININAQVEQTELAISNKVDGIIGCPLNPEAFEAVNKKAMDAGIPVINTGTDSEKEDTRTAYVGADENQMGIDAADVIADTFGKANVATLVTALDTANQIKSYDALKQRCEEQYPDIKIITIEATNSDVLQGIDVVNSVLKAYPEVDMFYCLEANAPIAASKAIVEQNLVGKVNVLGVSDLDETLDYIRDGVMFATIAQNSYMYGYEAVRLICEYIRDGITPPSVTDAGCVLITKDNVDTY